jgi:hypothetical protein
MFKNPLGNSILQNVLSKFKGQRLSIKNADFMTHSFKDIFADTSNLIYFELCNVKFQKHHQLNAILQALSKQPHLQTLKFSKSNIQDKDLESLKEC